MLDYLIDNAFVEFGGRICQHTIGIPMGTNCAPLLADLFLYSYEADFVQSLIKADKKRIAQQFNFTYRYTDEDIYKFLEYLEWTWNKRNNRDYNTRLVLGLLHCICALMTENSLLGFTTNGMTSA